MEYDLYSSIFPFVHSSVSAHSLLGAMLLVKNSKRMKYDPLCDGLVRGIDIS